MYKDICGTFRVAFSRQSCERRGARGGRAPKKPARSRPPRPQVLRQRKRESPKMRVDGSAPMRRGLVLVRSFFMPPAVPAHPSTRKPHAGGKASGACPQGATPYGEPHACRHPEALPPALRGERCAPPMAARSLFVRCRPLRGGVRWAASGGVDMCFAVWCVPVRMGIVLVRSFFIAHAAPTHQTTKRQTMRRTQPVRPRPHILGPQFPQNLPDTGQGLRKNPWALTPRPAPQNTTFGHIGMPLYSLARRGGACQHGRILGGRAGGGAHGLGGSPKAPPPVDPLPTHLRRALAAGVGAVGGLPLGAGASLPPPPPPAPLPPPPPCAVAPRRSRFRSVARPASPLPSQVSICWLPALGRGAVSLVRSICVFARPSCRPAGAARPPYPGFAPHPFSGGLCGGFLRWLSSSAL